MFHFSKCFKYFLTFYFYRLQAHGFIFQSVPRILFDFLFKKLEDQLSHFTPYSNLFPNPSFSVEKKQLLKLTDNFARSVHTCTAFRSTTTDCVAAPCAVRAARETESWPCKCDT